MLRLVVKFPVCDLLHSAGLGDTAWPPAYMVLGHDPEAMVTVERPPPEYRQRPYIRETMHSALKGTSNCLAEFQKTLKLTLNFF